MGITDCPKHGRQELRFATPAIAREIEAHSGAAIATIYALKLRWCDVWWVCLVDAAFLVQHGIPASASTRVTVVEDEERADELMGGMDPACRACLSEYLESSDDLRGIAAIWHDVERLPNAIERG
jgi:hypothetical protein